MANENLDGSGAGNEVEEEVFTIGDLKRAYDEDESERILNGTKNMVCTYPENYVPRQSLFACLTCQKDNDGKLAGVCFACSENCHEGHEILQLYTKRNFCCDCGNSKFKQKCTLFEEKIPENARNNYNHNFEGLYCVCNNPYPVPTDHPLFSEEMIQCCLCEDWFHAKHINVNATVYEDLEQEMVCSGCTTKYPWLVVYKKLLDKLIKYDEEKASGSQSESTGVSQPSEFSELNAFTSESVASAAPESTDTQSLATPAPSESTTAPNKFIPESSSPFEAICLLEKYADFAKKEESESAEPSGFIFASIEWRKLLCKCRKCKNYYEDEDIEYLTDENDSALRYIQENSKALAEKDKDLYQELANETNHDVALKVTTAISDLKHKFTEFFNTGEDRVITKEDVHKFFSEIANKKPRLEEPEE